MIQVFIISQYPLFGQGLRSILHEEREIDIIGQESDVDRAITRVADLQPDVIILDSDDSTDVTNAVLLQRLLQENPTVRVVGMSLKHDQLRTYTTEHRVIKSVSNLLDAIIRDGFQQVAK